jgi:hypothetical protein
MAFVQSQSAAPPSPAAEEEIAEDGPDEERPSIWTPGGEV